ncbi:RNA polymerase sigma factor [Euzebya sp.]|uniref:RNA polymerase sigma factor n=1 Tax=Euzebya sp. TaxID=1971409 RepID=UPI003516B64E
MTQPRDALDFRRAGEGVILDSLAAGHPLALAEAYHRSVPAAHAVARRLMAGADEVEAVLLGVYARLWADPPTTGPLEGWVRRATWEIGTERLRRDGTAPSSPSAAGLLPDLPAPDVRFLDAAERAIAELDDDERHALLLAHDRGIPSTEQDPGADEALARALVALAGPETSTADRASLHEDGCDDLPGLGDWCLGVASPEVADETSAAIDERPGCAAKSRTVRRGRRRIEGLPATPDMGQRILVTVLTSGDRPVAVPPGEGPAAEGPLDDDLLVGGPAVDGPVAEQPPLGDEGDQDLLTADDLTADDLTGEPAGGGSQIGEAAPEDLRDAALVDDADPDDPFGPLDATGPLEGAPAEAAPLEAAPLEATGPMPPVDAGTPVEDDPFRPVGDATGGDGAVGDGAVGDTADMPQAGADAPEEDVDWRPDPGSTAELRLSDILAEGDDDDDPFAGFDADPEPEPAPGRPADPYADLQHLGDEPAPAATPRPGPVVFDDEDAGLVGGYVEGQDHHVDHHDADVEPAGSNRMAALLSWVLPILGGSALGILIAIQVFGLPS